MCTVSVTNPYCLCLKLEKQLVLYFLKPYFINKEQLFLGGTDLTLNTYTAHQLEKRTEKCLSSRSHLNWKGATIPSNSQLSTVSTNVEKNIELKN